VDAELFGSLGATGHGTAATGPCSSAWRARTRRPSTPTPSRPAWSGSGPPDASRCSARHEIAFDERRQLVMHRRKALPYHPNGMRSAAFAADGTELRARTYYSVGGGFVVDEDAAGADRIKVDDTPVRFPFRTDTELLEHCSASGLPVSAVMLADELAWRDEDEVRARLLHIWRVMRECVDRGCSRHGVLPGRLRVRRRAAELHDALVADASDDPLRVMDWVSLFALAVNEENASGGRVVTAPTNGAAGIVPAVLHYYTR